MIKIIYRGKIPKIDYGILIFGMDGGMGHIAKIVGDYIIEELEMKEIISIYGSIFPSISISEDKVIRPIGAQIYYKKVKNKDILVLSGESQPIDDKSQYMFLNIMFRKVFPKINIKEIYTVGGYDIGVEPSKPNVYVAGTSRKTVESIIKKENLKEFNGNIAGLAGLLIAWAKLYKMKGLVLLAETVGHPMFIGLRGAREILKKLSSILDLEINLEKLEKEIEERDEMIKKGTKTRKIKRFTAIKDRVTYIG